MSRLARHSALTVAIVTGQADELMDAAAESRLQVRGLARNLRYQRSRWTPHLRTVSMLR